MLIPWRREKIAADLWNVMFYDMTGRWIGTRIFDNKEFAAWHETMYGGTT